MGLLDWFSKRQDRHGLQSQTHSDSMHPPGHTEHTEHTEHTGHARLADPVQVAKVRSFQAPILVAVLDQEGIASSVVEELAPATWETMGRVLVSPEDAEAAQQVLADFHSA